MSKCPPFHIVTPVWGRAFTKAFLELSLPSLLSPGNLPALPNRERNLYQIITTRADRATIEQSAAFRKLSRHISVQFNIIEEPAKGEDVHAVQSYCNRLGIMTADACDAAIVFYNPDILIADGSMRALSRLVASGKRAIDTVGVRTIRERMARLTAPHRSAAGDELTISPRQLVSMAMTSLHPVSMMHVYRAMEYDWMPSAIFWPVGRDGMIVRCFHLHPICVYPRVKNAPFTTTVDDDYLHAACPDPSDEYIVLDSDEFCIVEMSGLSRAGHSLVRPTSDYAYVEWAKTHAKPHHIDLFSHRIVLRGETRNEAEWQRVSTEADVVTTRILNGLVHAQAVSAFDETPRRKRRADARY